MFRTEATYDSNVLSSQTAQLSTVFNLIEGEGKYNFRDLSNTLELTFTGGERFYPKYSNLNSSLEDGRFQWEHAFTKRSKFAITGRWASLPEGTVEEGNPSQIITMLGNNDLSGSFLEQRVQVSEGTFSYEYSLSKHTSMIVGANYNQTNLRGLGLINTEEDDTYGGINYKMTRRQSVGLMYAHQWLYFSQGIGGSQVDNLLMTYNNVLTRDISFSAFGGSALVSLQPGTSGNSSTSVGSPTGALGTLGSRELGVVGGATLDAAFGKNKLRAEYTRLVTGGSGFLATVERQSTNVTATRSFSRHLEVSMMGAYTHNIQIGAANFGFKTFYVEPGIHYNLGRHLTLSARVSLGQVSGLAQYGTLSRNQLTTQLEYKFQQISFGR